MLPGQESIESVKEKLHKALKSRGLTELNGDAIPDDPSQIEFGTPIDRNELEKGWVRLVLPHDNSPVNGSATDGTSTRKAKSSSLTKSLQALGIQDGQAIAFRFKKDTAGQDGSGDEDAEFEDPGWDVLIPSLDDEGPE